jgi:hypothetical protein
MHTVYIQGHLTEKRSAKKQQDGELLRHGEKADGLSFHARSMISNQRMVRKRSRSIFIFVCIKAQRHVKSAVVLSKIPPNVDSFIHLLLSAR